MLVVTEVGSLARMSRPIDQEQRRLKSKIKAARGVDAQLITRQGASRVSDPHGRITKKVLYGGGAPSGA